MKEIIYNPDELRLVQGRIDCHIIKDKKWHIFFDRPQGDMYQALARRIDQICQDNDWLPLEKQLRRNYYMFIALGVAAREKAMPPEAVRLVEILLAQEQVEIDLAWHLLRLFRVVKQNAKDLGTELPEILQDERRAWGLMVLRGAMDFENIAQSKGQYKSGLRAEAQAIKDRRIFYAKDKDPEMYALFKYAFMLTHWDETVRDKDAKLPNSKRRARGQKRRQIQKALSAVRSGLTKVATDIDRPGYVWTKRDRQGRVCYVGNNNKLIPYAEFRTSQKQGGARQ